MKIPSLALVDVFENTDARALWHGSWKVSEPVFLNVNVAQESIPRNEFCQPM
jgi:hypothetical protein